MFKEDFKTLQVRENSFLSPKTKSEKEDTRRNEEKAITTLEAETLRPVGP